MWKKLAGSVGASSRAAAPLPFLLGPVALGLALLVAGCAAGSGGSSRGFDTEAGAGTIRIHVTNNNFADATLWATTPEGRRRVGMVTGKREEVFTLRWDTSVDLRMEIDLLATGRCFTRAMPVDPGDQIELIIDSAFPNSALCRGGL